MDSPAYDFEIEQSSVMGIKAQSITQIVLGVSNNQFIQKQPHHMNPAPEYSF